LVSLSIFLDPLFVATSPIFISIFLPFISLAGLFLQAAYSQPDFLGIFTSSFLGFPLVFILKQDFWGVFILFKLPYMFLMRK